MRVIVSEDVEPRKAIAMLEKLIALKKEELGLGLVERERTTTAARTK
jgi:hypothetical protein